MGTWGPGLYSCDLASDLRALVATLARLPLPDEELVDLAAATDPQVANDPGDHDHPVFWIALADQCARHGIESPRARALALAAIDDGADLAACRRLGMSEDDAARRQAELREVRERIAVAAGSAPPPRKTLKKPQPLLLEPGDCVVYPVGESMLRLPWRFHAINPYLANPGKLGWKRDGWGAALILEAGHAFGFLAWYRPAVVLHHKETRPTLDDVREARIVGGTGAGTCSPLRFKRMKIERIGRLALDASVVAGARWSSSGSFSPQGAAIADVCMSNRLADPPPDGAPAVRELLLDTEGASRD